MVVQWLRIHLTGKKKKKKNSPYNARDTGSIPGWGTKISHATEQLSPHCATREKPECCSEDSTCHN